ncbi:MRG/MORF4L-binding protein [Harpegnathos saltator]|uniref:MRG-binding protein n=1 Tax=Harpegnathos saltator TaxID=610380 RepID=E2C479_HARSA|nr:MRG/MORF4L-binding protein [Harpegnathos saltator]XP_019700048.1 MRG/MORF4L-binding protein [Harpegnathos saltator]EFN77250.1 MRG-binding protein [Harpegnathos saltator]
MAVKEKHTETSFDEIEWNVDNEIQLFFAMNGHKPVGINKYFHMLCIWEKFRIAIHKDIPLKIIWDHLESMYDLMALDDMEGLPFPSQEIDFSLPEIEFDGKPWRKEELEIKLKDQKDKYKEIKKEKDIKESSKKDSMLRDIKGCKDIDKKKEEIKKYAKDMEMKKDKFRDIKDARKEHKSSKGRSKSKDDIEETSNIRKERKDSESGRELLKRIPKRPTRQSMENSSKASSSPRDTPPPKRRRI